MIGRCEACNEAITHESLTGLCTHCEQEWEGCHDDE